MCALMLCKTAEATLQIKQITTELNLTRCSDCYFVKSVNAKQNAVISIIAHSRPSKTEIMNFIWHWEKWGSQKVRLTNYIYNQIFFYQTSKFFPKTKRERCVHRFTPFFIVAPWKLGELCFKKKQVVTLFLFFPKGEHIYLHHSFPFYNTYTFK